MDSVSWINQTKDSKVSYMIESVTMESWAGLCILLVTRLTMKAMMDETTTATPTKIHWLPALPALSTFTTVFGREVEVAPSGSTREGDIFAPSTSLGVVENSPSSCQCFQSV